jgi:acyl carrier protein
VTSRDYLAGQVASTTAPNARDRILETLRPHLGEVAPGEEIPLDTPLGDLGLDSVQAIEAILSLEEQFGVVFPDDLLTLRLFDSVETLEQAVADLKSSQAEGGVS